LNAKSLELNEVTVIPEKIIVRTYTNISIAFKIDTFLPINSIISLRIRGGRNNKNDWYYLQPFDRNQRGFIELSINPFSKVLPIQITGKELAVKYIICEKNGIKEGATFQFKIYDTLVQSLVENNKKFEILIKKPNSEFLSITNPPRVDIINGSFDHITIICPSIVENNEKFKIRIRIEDKTCNLVQDFSDVLEVFQITNSNSKESIRMVKFTEDDNGLRLESDFSLQKPEIYHFEVSYKSESFKSNPVMCVNENYNNKLYWGYIHGHTNKSDGIRDPIVYFENLINAGLDFGTSTEHDHIWETSDVDFEELRRINEQFNTDEFITLFGYEWGYWYTGFGDICIYTSDPKLPILRSDTNKYNSTQKLIKHLRIHKDKVLLIAHHTALRPGYRNWDFFDNTIERLVEIYSTWGNQEYPHDAGNPIPPRYKFFGHGKFTPKKGPIIEKRGSFVQDALKRGYKLGFTAGGDDHFGIYPSGPFSPDNGIYPSGIMAVWATKLTRKSIWDALLNRRCYGTTGPRVIIEFRIDGFLSGEIIDSNDFPRTLQDRTIKLKIISPLNIEKVEIIRNNNIFKSQIVNSTIFEINCLDSDPFNEIYQLHQDKNEKFVFYYPRIYLSNNDMAWASPIWIINKK
jgi:hypothetical protein